MDVIKKITPLQILDSRGVPTLCVYLETLSGLVTNASIPSGASTGSHEAKELRDKSKKEYLGKGVLTACNNVLALSKKLKGISIFEQTKIDALMIQEDGTYDKSSLGANTILGISLAVARAAAKSGNMELFQYIAQLFENKTPTLMPVPMFNIINGGVHADNTIDFQEFMIRPIGAPSFSEALRYSAEVFQHLKMLLKKEKLNTTVGDEGGFAPNLKTNEMAIEMIMSAIERAGYRVGDDFTLALDCAATEFYSETTKSYYKFKNPNAKDNFSTEEQIEVLKKLVKKYPVDSIEDGLDENDWEGWKKLTSALNSIQIVGDDLFVTNPKFLKKGIDNHVANAILIKLNQIGTLSETLQTIKLAKQANYKTIISHRSGETEDTFIADLAVGTSSGQIKTGSLSRSDRIAKYNRLLRIEQLLATKALYHI